MLKVKFGVPQGSILGPILFNLYVTHLNINGPSTYLQYADDTTLLRHVKLKNLQQTVTSMQDEMNEIYNWSSSNNLQLNIAKTKLMLFSTKQMSRIHNLHDVGIKISSNNKNIERVNTIKILGVNFNEHLTWQDHIKCVLQNGFATLKTLKQFKRTADMNLKKSLVQSLVLSKIQYCNVVYSHAPDYLICRLQKLQRAAASFVLSRYSNDVDILNLKWLPVKESLSLSIVKLAHKSLYDNSFPNYMKLHFKPSPQKILRNGSTKSNEIVTNNMEGTFPYNASKNFNDLPSTVRKIDDYTKFSILSKKYFIDKAMARVISLNN